MPIQHKSADVPVAFRAAGCFCLCDDHVLLIQRQRGKFLAGHWGIPTGKLETAESPQQATVRELAEEVGLHVAAERLVPIATYLVDDAGLLFEYAAFALLLESRPPLVLKPDEVRQAEWVPVDSVRKRRVVPFFYDTLRDLLAWREAARRS